MLVGSTTELREGDTTMAGGLRMTVALTLRGADETGSLMIAPMEAEAFGTRLGRGRAQSRCTSTTSKRRSEVEHKGVGFNGAVSSAVCLQAIFEHPDGKALILQNRHGRS
jgi:hypothetical protein